MAMFDFLDNIWKPIGKGLSETDTFMKREMPFDSGWGAPAALVATYFGGPAVMEAFGEGAGAIGGEGLGSYMGSAGLDAGSFGNDAFSMGGDFGNLMTTDPASFGEGWSASGFDNGGYSPQDQLGLDNLINQQSAKYPMDGATGKPTFQQLLGRQLMQGNLGSSMGKQSGYQYQEQPVQRQGAFLPVTQAPAIQEKKADIEALISALRSKGAI